MRKIFASLGLAGLLLGSSSGFAAAQPQTQCVSNALAGGTVDHITIPLQPCALSTNILILTLAGANTIAQPTLQMSGYPAMNIYTSGGAAPGIAALPGAGYVVMLTSTGSAWKIVSGNSSTVFSGVLTVPNGGTGDSTLTANALLVGQGTGAVTAVTAGTTGQILLGNTSSPPSWLAAGTTGKVLQAVTGSAPAWTTISSNYVTSISFASTGLTPATATSGAVTVGGTLGVGYGGTGLTTGYSNGVLPVGNGTGFTAATITAGTNITVTNGAGTITLAASGSTTACGGGSVAGYVLTDNGSNGCTSNPGMTYAAGVVSLGVNTSQAGKVKFFGSTSGDLTLRAAAVAGTASVLTLPGGTTDLSATGGTSQVVKQVSAGAALTVGQLACADLSNASSGCSGAAALTEGGVKIASFNAASNTTYCVDTVTGAAAITATLPASPSNNDQIEFVSCSNYSTYNLILARNGNNLQGLAANMTNATDNASFSVKFYTSYGWRMK